MDPPPPIRGRARARARVTVTPGRDSPGQESAVQQPLPSSPQPVPAVTPAAVAAPVSTPPPSAHVVQTSSTTAKPQVEQLVEKVATSLQVAETTTVPPATGSTVTASTTATTSAIATSRHPYSFNVTKPQTKDFCKLGEYPSTVPLVTNYFQAKIDAKWELHQYTVSFDPPYEEEQTRARKGIFRSVGGELPAYVFDGLMLFTVGKLPRYPMTLVATDKFTQTPVTITIDSHVALTVSSPVCLQIYNIFVNKCLEHLKLVQINRKYFNPEQKTVISHALIEIWPGFATSLRYHETSLLLRVEMVSKVICTKNVFQIIYEIRQASRRDRGANDELEKKAVETELANKIVMTRYNHRTYPIESILWDQNPQKTFPTRDGSERSYMEYYKTQYGITIRSENQPLLLTGIKERDIRRGVVSKRPILIPELCVVTGITEAMKSNFRLKNEMDAVLFAGPAKRVQSLEDFMKRFNEKNLVQDEMKKWEIAFDSDKLLRLKGGQLSEEKVYAAGREYSAEQFSKSVNLRNKLHDPKRMEAWIALVPQRDQAEFNKFLDEIVQVSRPMNFRLEKPSIVILPDIRGATYLDKIDREIAKYKGSVSMIFAVLPNNRGDLYSVIKQKATSGYGIPSQCCLAKNLKKGLSVASKIVVQMSCKVGGVPWIIANPLKDPTMILGFDVYHSGGIGGTSVGAIVATMDANYSRHCSYVTKHKHRQEISHNMAKQVIKCLGEYYKCNNGLPTRIYFYRDGVGDGQVDIVHEMEMQPVVEAAEKLYKEKRREPPKFAYIIVSKRINSRFMTEENGHFGNPKPGTVVASDVTMHYRYDFFLVSQITRQGTVSPTNYNVILDTIGMKPLRLQQFTYRLCHNYYNWTGTVSVPSVCQLAHKLAYITGESIKDDCKESLRHLPYYL